MAVIDDAAKMIRTRLDELDKERQRLEPSASLGLTPPVEDVLPAAVNQGRSLAVVVTLRKALAVPVAK